MACALTTGFQIGCNDSSGGIVEFLIGSFGTLGAVTQNASGMVTTIAGSAFMYTYEAEKATSTVNEGIMVNRENGTVYYEQTANYILNKASQDKRNEIKIIAQALMVVIAKDKNGKYWLMGQGAGVRLDASTAAWGTALADRNGYTLNFKAEEVDMMPEVDSSIIAALIA
tara:strand:+ start:543 stop:1052 length:510 start_codon:yes stop_codon:yes gene_type:complete